MKVGFVGMGSIGRGFEVMVERDVIGYDIRKVKQLLNYQVVYNK